MSHFNRLRFHLLPMVILLASSAPVFGQSGGHWQLALSLRGWTPEHFVFADSNWGILVAEDSHDSDWALRTENGGQNFIFNRMGDRQGVFGEYPKNFASFPDRSTPYFFNPSSISVLSFDSGNSWFDQSYSNINSQNEWHGSKMFKEGHGRILCYSSKDSGVSVWETVDSAKSWRQREGQPILPAAARIAYWRDSAEVWFTDGGLNGAHHASDTIWNSVDGGQSYRKIHGEPIGQYLAAVVATKDLNTLFFLSFWPYGTSKASPRTDFVCTTDHGSTWRADSTFGGARIYHMFAASPHTVWAFVGAKPTEGYHRDDYWADTLYYSSDAGLHWSLDGNFGGDTLIDMAWPDSTHGYLALERDSTMMIYRFIPASASVAQSSLANPEGIQFVSSPVGSTLKFQVPASGLFRVRVVDLLGRQQIQADHRITSETEVSLDVHQLTPGVYELVLESDDHHKISRSFVKE